MRVISKCQVVVQQIILRLIPAEHLGGWLLTRLPFLFIQICTHRFPQFGQRLQVIIAVRLF